MKVSMITTVVHDTDNLIIRDVPVSSTVLELEDGSLAIIDTGMAGNPDLILELEELGYTASDFNLVFNTHLHPDHIGGNRLFTRARILISRRELAYEEFFSRMLQGEENPINALRAMGRVLDHTSHQLVRDLKQLAEKYPASSLVGDEGQIEFYEDNPLLPDSISLLQVPGHSIDSRAVVVRGRTRRVVVAGDALYHRDLWREDTMLAIHYDQHLFRLHAKSLARFPDIIVPGHDRAFDNLNGEYIRSDNLEI